MFAGVALGVPRKQFEQALVRKKVEAGVEQDADRSVAALQELVVHYRELVLAGTSEEFPADPRNQLRRGILVLLEKGAAVNQTDKDGTTALLLAADHGHRDVVEILRKSGAVSNKNENTSPAFRRVEGVDEVLPEHLFPKYPLLSADLPE